MKDRAKGSPSLQRCYQHDFNLSMEVRCSFTLIFAICSGSDRQRKYILLISSFNISKGISLAKTTAVASVTALNMFLQVFLSYRCVSTDEFDIVLEIQPVVNLRAIRYLMALFDSVVESPTITFIISTISWQLIKTASPLSAASDKPAGCSIFFLFIELNGNRLKTIMLLAYFNNLLYTLIIVPLWYCL